MKNIFIQDLQQHLDSEASVKAWVETVRDQGKAGFIQLRDRTGGIQCGTFGVGPLLDTVKTLRSGDVVEVIGLVKKRPERSVAQGVLNGDIEIEISGLNVITKSEVLPFDIESDTRVVDEDVRLEKRYIDLRSARMQKNLEMRHKMQLEIRNYLNDQRFFEIETPLLTKSTPEGARDYIVPSRLSPHNFYALPQSPQQYKQLLMVSGMERYFQFARCMRDEDLRGDRQPEFTQLDMEMSFVEREDVMELNEKLLIHLVQKFYPEKKIQQIPFPRIPYAEAMEKYGNDRPDIREDKEDPNLLAFCWVVDFPQFERTDTSDDPLAQGEWTFTHNPFSHSIPEHRENLSQKKNIGDIIAAQYDVVLNGYEIGGGSIRNHDKDTLISVFEILGHSREKIEENFGHMLEAFTYGVPPHGGIAWGFDRLMMILQNEPNIREVIAFPKTRGGNDPMMGSPSLIADERLKEVHIQLRELKK